MIYMAVCSQGSCGLLIIIMCVCHLPQPSPSYTLDPVYLVQTRTVYVPCFALNSASCTASMPCLSSVSMVLNVKAMQNSRHTYFHFPLCLA